MQLIYLQISATMADVWYCIYLQMLNKREIDFPWYENVAYNYSIIINK